MNYRRRSVLFAVLLLGIGAVVGVWAGWQSGGEGNGAIAGLGSRSSSVGTLGSDGPRQPAALIERRLERLTSTLAAEANERRRLEERLESLTAEIASLRASAGIGESASPSANNGAPNGANRTAPAAAGAHSAAEAQQGAAAEDGATATERALAAAGVDATTAADIRRRRDELTLSELYLRDQATRENWQNTPRFREEMAAIDQQRTSMRDEIGDDAYDRYLAALGEPNRVTVDEVMVDSAAAQAGLQSGDVVLRYGEARIFAPGELVAETRSGTAGETVRLEIMRGGQRLEIEVPRGPLGLRIAASRGNPDES